MDVEFLPEYDEERGATVIGDWFLLTRNGRNVRCEIRTHPTGWELRVIGTAADVGFEFAKVCTTQSEVFEMAERWHRRMITSGWGYPS